MEPTNQQLEARIEALEKQLASLNNSSTISYGVDRAFIGRGYLKTTGAPIYLIGADQGSWLNGQTGSGMAFPSAFGVITEGNLAGFWVPLYIPPRAVAL